MSEKMSCPACDAYTSSVLQAFREGAPCPSCDLPASAAILISAARARGADAKLVENYQAAIKRAEVAEKQVRELKWRLDQVRDAMSTSYSEDAW